jgi:hypothetical protein
MTQRLGSAEIWTGYVFEEQGSNDCHVSKHSFPSHNCAHVEHRYIKLLMLKCFM